MVEYIENMAIFWIRVIPSSLVPFWKSPQKELERSLPWFWKGAQETPSSTCPFNFPHNQFRKAIETRTFLCRGEGIQKASSQCPTFPSGSLKKPSAHITRNGRTCDFIYDSHVHLNLVWNGWIIKGSCEFLIDPASGVLKLNPISKTEDKRNRGSGNRGGNRGKSDASPPLDSVPGNERSGQSLENVYGDVPSVESASAATNSGKQFNI